MKCTRGRAAQIAGKGPQSPPSCTRDAVKFFEGPGGFSFAACPEHAQEIPRSYEEVSWARYHELQSEQIRRNAQRMGWS